MNIFQCKPDGLVSNLYPSKGEENLVKKINNDLNKTRREFIKNSTLIGAGVAATAVLPGTAIASSEIEKPEDKKQKGYQLTEHILEYYKSAAS
jgi:hypothetical protein